MFPLLCECQPCQRACNGGGVGVQEADEAAGDAVVTKAWNRRSHMFPQHTPLGTSKRLSFRRRGDLKGVVYYDSTASDRLPAGNRCDAATRLGR